MALFGQHSRAAQLGGVLYLGSEEICPDIGYLDFQPLESNGTLTIKGLNGTNKSFYQLKRLDIYLNYQ